MLTELLRLTGGQIAMGGPTGTRDDFSQTQPTPTIDLGWSGSPERGVSLQFLQDEMHTQDPALSAFGQQLATRGPLPTVLTRSRRQLASDGDWYGSAAFCDYHRPSGTDDGLMSVVVVPDGQVHGIALFRPPTERRFTPRHRRLVHLFHSELVNYLRTELAPHGCDPIFSFVATATRSTRMPAGRRFGAAGRAAPRANARHHAPVRQGPLPSLERQHPRRIDGPLCAVSKQRTPGVVRTCHYFDFVPPLRKGQLALLDKQPQRTTNLASPAMEELTSASVSSKSDVMGIARSNS